MSGVLLELGAESNEWNTTGLYVIQGLIVFALGFDVAVNAALESTAARSIKNTIKYTISKEMTIGVLVVPSLWLLLSWMNLASHAYACEELPCRAKHFLYPLLFVFRNHRLYMALYTFGSEAFENNWGLNPFL